MFLAQKELSEESAGALPRNPHGWELVYRLRLCVPVQLVSSVQFGCYRRITCLGIALESKKIRSGVRDCVFKKQNATSAEFHVDKRTTVSPSLLFVTPANFGGS